MSTKQGSDRRHHARVEVNWPVVILTHRGATVGETINIGVDGAFIFCPVPLLRKETPKLFILAPVRQPMSVSVEVTWSNLYSSEQDTPPPGMGVRFTQISDVDRQYLHEMVAISKHYEKKAGRLAGKR